MVAKNSMTMLATNQERSRKSHVVPTILLSHLAPASIKSFCMAASFGA